MRVNRAALADGDGVDLGGRGRDGVGVRVGVRVLVGVRVAVGDGVDVDVRVLVRVAVGVRVGVRVGECVGVLVRVGVLVGECVDDLDGVWDRDWLLVWGGLGQWLVVDRELRELEPEQAEDEAFAYQKAAE